MTSRAENALERTAPLCPPPTLPFLFSFPPVPSRWIMSPLTGSGDKFFSELGKRIY